MEPFYSEENKKQKYPNPLNSQKPFDPHRRNATSGGEEGCVCCPITEKRRENHVQIEVLILYNAATRLCWTILNLPQHKIHIFYIFITGIIHVMLFMDILNTCIIIYNDNPEHRLYQYKKL